MNREKRTVSGPLLEVDLYPVWEDGRRMRVRAPKSKKSSAQQQQYNKLQAEKKMVRKVNANFNKTDYFVSMTYWPESAPQNEGDARRDFVNFIRRVKTARAAAIRETKAALKEATVAADAMPGNSFLRAEVRRLKKKLKKLKRPLKYIYVIEEEIYKTGSRAGCSNWHFHLFITGGLEAEEMEALWIKGERVNCARFQPDRFGPEAAAKYMSKDPKGSKRYCCSRNLTQPVEKTRDGRYSNRQLEKIATRRADDAAWWERNYPSYTLLETYCRWNEYNSHWYVTAVMYAKTETPPAWNAPAWLTADELTGISPEEYRRRNDLS